ncbi:MAG TPA: ATP-dependent Clp protease proteolytic subunit [Candidatus Micrarchaeaceae archaeon]|nr:ATP-dependent Clp protease proteolytic subunit [Candidatus Micrarchaeaceae archaeon]
MYRNQSGAVPHLGSVIPTVLDQSMRGERAYDIYSLLLKERIVFLGQEVDDQIANLLVAEILYLEGQDPERDIHLYINSPGGLAYSGMAIYDVMQHVTCEVSTFCIGMAMSAAAMILCGGAAGKRLALPSSKIMIHQGSAGTRGAPRDMEIQLREVLANTQRMAEILAHHSGRPLEQVERDIDRDYYLTANEALEYGLIDEVLVPRRGLAAARAPLGGQSAPVGARG